MSDQSWIVLAADAHSGVTVVIGPKACLLIIGLLVAGAGLAIYRARQAWGSWEIEEANISLGHVGQVRIKPNRESLQLAHRAWVELVSRKAALPIDEENDVIVEVYDSWYQLFRELRALARECPARLYRTDESVRQTVDIMLKAMNHGLRPHLTRWQARFRAWYSHELQKRPGEAPQSVQRGFPQYAELIADLKIVNAQLVEYAEFLGRVVHGREKRLKN